MFRTIVNVFFTLCFLLFAYFNLDDADAVLWVAIYLLTALICALAIFKRQAKFLSIAVFIFFLLYAGYFFFSEDGVLDWLTKYNRPSIAESMKATKPYIEKTREFFGLLIALFAIGFNLFLFRDKKQLTRP